MRHFVHRNGQQLGPYEEEQLRSMLARGEIAPQDLVFSEGTGAWVPLSAVLGLPPTPGYGPPPSAFAPSPYGGAMAPSPYGPPMAPSPYGPPMAPSPYGPPPYGSPSPYPMAPYPGPGYPAIPGTQGPPKSRVAYILLGLFLGGLGIHNFYAGYTGRGIAQLLITVLTFWLVLPLLAVGIWVLVEVITVTHDQQGMPFA